MRLPFMATFPLFYMGSSGAIGQKPPEELGLPFDNYWHWAAVGLDCRCDCSVQESAPQRNFKK
jgi:hypothetical protein